MIPGDTIHLTIGRQTIGRQPVTGSALSSLKVTATLDGVDKSSSISPALTYIGLSQDSLWGLYKLDITLPSTAGFFELFVSPSSGLDPILGGYFAGEIEGNDADSVAALLLLSQGQPAVTSAADSNLGDVVFGDSYLSSTLTMPAGKLSPFGITDISAVGITVEAAIMDAPGGTSYPITATVVSGPGLTFTIGWDVTTMTTPLPSLGTKNSVPYYIDVQVIKTGPPKKVITTNRYTFTQVWERDTRTT